MTKMAETENTILVNFIAEKTAEFSPISRQGLPRGELVGLRSLTKYKAALLLAVTKLNPKQIGEKLSMPAQSVRLFANQSAFKLQVGTFQIQFAERVLDALEGHTPCEAFNDRSFYSEKVVVLIRDFAENRSRKVQVAVVDLFGSVLEIQFMSKSLLLNDLLHANDVLTKRRLSQTELDFLRGTVKQNIQYMIGGN